MGDACFGSSFPGGGEFSIVVYGCDRMGLMGWASMCMFIRNTYIICHTSFKNSSP